MKMRTLALLTLLLSLTACASTSSLHNEDVRAARFEAAAGQSVSHLQLLSRGFYAWDALNDHQVVAYTTPKKAYLLDLPTCPGLEHASAVAITSRMSQVSVNFDSVTSNRTDVPCPIKRIRPIDLQQVKDAGSQQGGEVHLMPQSKHAGSTDPGA